MDRVRLDKWLWAARFFRTRAKAKEAIDGGKVQVDGSRSKPSREVQVGDELKVRQGWDEKTVIVRALSDQRRGAPEAEALYEETAESVKRREAEAERRRLAQNVVTDGRPSKRDRRHITRFKDLNNT
ncbi:MAG: RNA-binding S4 domain-containing protein [Pseudomonadota bacterium]